MNQEQFVSYLKVAFVTDQSLIDAMNSELENLRKLMELPNDSIRYEQISEQMTFVRTAMSACPEALRQRADYIGDPEQWLRDKYDELVSAGWTIELISPYVTISKDFDEPYELSDGRRTVSFPPYKMTFSVAPQENILKFRNLNCMPTVDEYFADEDGYWHPHCNVSGDVCLGTLEQSLPNMIATLEMDVLYDMASTLMSTYNGNSPYRELWRFVSGCCEVCGTVNVRVDVCSRCETTRCDNCQMGSGCKHCSTTCDQCSATVERSTIKEVACYSVDRETESISVDDSKYVCEHCFGPLSERMSRRAEFMQKLAELTDETTDETEEPVDSAVSTPLIREIPDDDE